MLFQHWAPRITAATLDRGAFCSAGPDFFSTTSPQPMMPQTTSFGASAPPLSIDAIDASSKGTSARQPATKARWVSLGFALTINLTINYCDLVMLAIDAWLAAGFCVPGVPSGLAYSKPLASSARVQYRAAQPPNRWFHCLTVHEESPCVSSR